MKIMTILRVVTRIFVPSWGACLKLWKEEFPHLTIAKAPYRVGGYTTVAVTHANKDKWTMEQLKEERGAACKSVRAQMKNSIVPTSA
jgi:hypothetical protein